MKKPKKNLRPDKLKNSKNEVRSLIDFFQNSPHRDVEITIERRKDLPRFLNLY